MSFVKRLSACQQTEFVFHLHFVYLFFGKLYIIYISLHSISVSDIPPDAVQHYNQTEDGVNNNEMHLSSQQLRN